MNKLLSPNNISIPAGRLDVVDALRGLALAAIILIHFIEHFIYNVYPAETHTWLDQLNTLIGDSFFLLFAGKAYSIFAVLFGFSYWIQYARRKEKGSDYTRRFAWRLFLLFIFGWVDGLFFIGGDILSLYAIVGLALIPLRRVKTSILLGIGIFLLCQPIELFFILKSYLEPSANYFGTICSPFYKSLKLSTDTGNWGVFLWENIKFSQLATLVWSLEFGRVTQTFGLFILGFLAGRHGLFVPSEKTQKFWGICFLFSAIASWPLWIAYECIQIMPPNTQLISSSTVLLHMWLNLAMTGVISSIFIILYQIPILHRWSDPLRLYGSMSLTNYVSQSVIGALLFFPIGLGLASYLGKGNSFLLGILVLYLQLLFCRWWKKKHSKGPLEALWAQLTWINK